MSGLEDVKVGDWVLLPYGMGHNQLARKRVAKVTKQHIVLEESSDKYQINGGAKVGDASKYWREWIMPWDEEKWRDYVIASRKIRIIHELTDFKWATLDSELAAKIHAMLPKPVKEGVE